MNRFLAGALISAIGAVILSMTAAIYSDDGLGPAVAFGGTAVAMICGVALAIRTAPEDGNGGAADG